MLRPESRWGNIYKSLNAYVQTTLVVGAGVTVLYPGLPAFDSAPVRWVDMAYVPLAKRRETVRVRHGVGHERQLLVNCNCYEQTAARSDNSGQASLYSLAVLVDTLIDAFPVAVAIPIRDYSTPGNPTVALFQWRDMLPPHTIRRDAIEQVNVSITMAFEEEWDVVEEEA